VTKCICGEHPGATKTMTRTPRKEWIIPLDVSGDAGKALQKYFPAISNELNTEGTKFLKSFRSATTVEFEELAEHVYRRFERQLTTLLSIHEPWVMAFCGEWADWCKCDAKSFMYRAVAHEGFTKTLVGDFIEYMKTIEAIAGFSMGMRSLGIIFDFKSWCRSRVEHPVLTVELEQPLRECQELFAALSDVWADWSSDSDDWLVACNSTKAFQRAAAFAADCLGLVSKSDRQESWKVWLDWLMQEEASDYVVLNVITTDDCRFVDLKVGFRNTAEVSRNSIMTLLSRVMRLKQEAKQRIVREHSSGLDPEDVPTFKDIEKALAEGDRRGAVALWMGKRKAENKPHYKAVLHRRAKLDKSEFFKWQRGDLPNGSAADMAIRRMLTSDWI